MYLVLNSGMDPPSGFEIVQVTVPCCELNLKRNIGNCRELVLYRGFLRWSEFEAKACSDVYGKQVFGTQLRCLSDFGFLGWPIVQPRLAPLPMTELRFFVLHRLAIVNIVTAMAQVRILARTLPCEESFRITLMRGIYELNARLALEPHIACTAAFTSSLQEYI